MLLGTICAISLFVITPVARGDETTAQTNEYVSVFESYDNWEWEETSEVKEAIAKLHKTIYELELNAPDYGVGK